MIRRDRIAGLVKSTMISRRRLTGKITLKSTEPVSAGSSNLDFSDSSNSGHIVTLGL